jgi:hypothetical protein
LQEQVDCDDPSAEQKRSHISATEPQRHALREQKKNEARDIATM